MNIISEIQTMRKQLDFLVKSQGDNMSFFESLKTEIENAFKLLENSKTVIQTLNTQVAAQANTIVQHEATIANLTSTSTAVNSQIEGFVGTVHAKFKEFENFINSTVVLPVEAEANVIVSEVESTVNNVVSYFESNNLANNVATSIGNTVASTIETEANVIITDVKSDANVVISHVENVASEVTHESLDDLYNKAVGVVHNAEDTTITIKPL
jgi:hypothetical protein